ncbi:MAG TPA: hypothetical protein VNA68_01560 [Candidatus Dormibacteraeota bacterium]|nr:hypothetical protein [Candidatus Dormibacteraeota bacterium]
MAQDQKCEDAEGMEFGEQIKRDAQQNADPELNDALQEEFSGEETKNHPTFGEQLDHSGTEGEETEPGQEDRM